MPLNIATVAFPTILLATIVGAQGARPALPWRKIGLVTLGGVVTALVLGIIPAIPIAPMLALACFDSMYHAVPRTLLTTFVGATLVSGLLWWFHNGIMATHQWEAWLAIAALGLIASYRVIRVADRVGLAGLAIAYGPASGLAALFGLISIGNRRIPLFAALAPGAILAAGVMRWVW